MASVSSIPAKASVDADIVALSASVVQERET
jgi:hypothetical protein